MKINTNRIIIGGLTVLGVLCFANTAAATPHNNHYAQIIKHKATPVAFSFLKPQTTKTYYSKLSDQELKNVLKTAGFSGYSLKVAWAVAKKESGANPMSHNTNINTGDNSYGLFQINMLGSMGPDRRAKYGLTNNNQLFNPYVNAKIAYAISNHGSSWGPWHGITGKTQYFINQFPG